MPVPTSGAAAPAPPRQPGWRLVATALVPLALVAAAGWALFGHTRIWYGIDDVTDTMLYQAYGVHLLAGYRPYLDFPVEYPPLALPLFALPAGAREPYRYARLFNLEMLACLGLAALVVAWTAARQGAPGEPAAGRSRASSLAFAAAVAALGAVVVNRYDAAVALSVAAALALSAADRHGAAGVALGLGFALKLVPALLLPLVLIAATGSGWRPAARAAMGFGLAAVLPFLPFLWAAPAALAGLFRYHLARPLQIESMLATPLLLAHVAGLSPIAVASGFGSQNLVSDAADTAAELSGPLAALAFGVVLALCWRRRAALRTRPAGLDLAALATLLAVLSSGKVLSPQFFTWLLPAAALVLPTWRVPGLLVLATLVLTHLEFPAHSWDVVALRPGAVALVAVRYLALLAGFAAALVALWRLPVDPRR